MGDAGPVMDDDTDVNEFFQILAEPPASPIQVKAPQEESIEEQQLNIGTPPLGLDSSNFNLHYDPYSDKEHALARKRDRYSMHPKAAHASRGARMHPKTRVHTSQGSAGIPYSSIHIRTNSLRDLLQANRGTAIFQINDDNKIARWVRSFEHLMGWMSIDSGPL